MKSELLDELRVEVESRKKVIERLCSELAEKTEFGAVESLSLTQQNALLQNEIRRLNEVYFSHPQSCHEFMDLDSDLAPSCPQQSFRRPSRPLSTSRDPFTSWF